MQYLSSYECPNCGHEWQETWECACNDQCPECGTKDIEPYEYDEVKENEN